MARTVPYSNLRLSNSKNSEGFAGNDTCAICLTKFTDETIAVPEYCNHAFCWSCLEVWERKKKICPIDREPFANKYRIADYRVYKSYISRLRWEEIFIQIACSICFIADNDPTRKCTFCTSVYHEKCLDNLNCPTEWKINESTGTHINHAFCVKRFRECEQEDIIQVDSGSESSDSEESMDSSASTDDSDEEMPTEDESQDEFLGISLWFGF